MKRNKKVIVTLVFIALVAMSVSACRKSVSSNPQVVFAASMLTAADSVDAVATGLAAANDMIEKIQSQEPEYYAHAKPIIRRIADATNKARLAVQLAKNGDRAVDWKGAIIAISTAAGNEDLSVFGFKNPNSQALVKVGLASLQAGIAALTSFKRASIEDGGQVMVGGAAGGANAALLLIAAILQLFSTYGPGLVKLVTDIIDGNPQNTGESDADYIVRLNMMTDAALADAKAKLDPILNEPQPGK